MGSDVKAVLMAGGRGLRLRPLTLTVPKHLLPIDGEMIIKRILRRFIESGIEDVVISLGYLARITRACLEADPELLLNLTLSFVEEDQPLGTAGALSLIRNNDQKTIIVHNADILCDVDFHMLIDFHRRKNAAITVMSALYDQIVPYGVLKFDKEGVLKNWHEKLEQQYRVSSGVYLLDSEVVQMLKENEPLDMPELIMRCHKRGMKVTVYCHEGMWIDVGNFTQYEKAAMALLSNKIQEIEHICSHL